MASPIPQKFKEVKLYLQSSQIILQYKLVCSTSLLASLLGVLIFYLGGIWGKFLGIGKVLDPISPASV